MELVAFVPSFALAADDMALKVVHLAASVGAGGAATALLNLHKGLCQIGVDSSILAGNGQTAGATNVRIIENPFEGSNRLVYSELISRNRTPLSNTLFSFDAGGIFVNSEREILDADIIQLHWVANFLTTSSLSALASLGKPVLWTLHDMRPFTGGCHYSAGCKGFRQKCQSCPQLRPALHHFPARAHIGQTDAVRLLQPVFVAPSKWLANECVSSSVADSCRVEVIPYGIDARRSLPCPSWKREGASLWMRKLSTSCLAPIRLRNKEKAACSHSKPFANSRRKRPVRFPQDSGGLYPAGQRPSLSMHPGALNTSAFSPSGT